MTKMIPVIALMTLAACGVSSQKSCDRAAECWEELGGEGEYDVDACVTATDQFEADADAADCGGEYKDLAKCGVKAECDDATACEAEGVALFACMAGGTDTTEE